MMSTLIAGISIVLALSLIVLVMLPSTWKFVFMMIKEVERVVCEWL